MSSDRVPPPPEKARHLVLLATAPVIWMLHFLLSYATASVWCARFVARGDPLGPAQGVIVAYTVVALFGIVACGWIGYTHYGRDGEIDPHASDSPLDRHRFLGFATLLLAGLSVVATLYVASAAIFIPTCH